MSSIKKRPLTEPAQSIREPWLAAFGYALFGILSLFILYPLGWVVAACLQDSSGNWDFTVVPRILFSAQLAKPALNTLVLGLSVAAVSTLVGFLFAYAVTRTDLKWKRLLTVTATFPMISPPFLVALSAIILFGNNGLLTTKLLGGASWFSIYGFWGLLMAESMAFFPTAFLICSALLGQIDPVMEEAAWNAGAGKIRSFFTVLLPLSAPGLLSSFLLVFIESLADFANPLVLSGDFKVLSVEAYLKIVGSELDFSGGAVMALMLLVPAVTAFVIQQVWLSKKSFVTVTGKPSSASLQRLGRTGKIFWWSVCLFLSSGIYLFYGTVLVGSLTKLWGVDSTLTLDHYTSAITSQWGTISDSLLLAVIATPFSGVLGIAVAYIVVRTRIRVRRAIEWVSLLTFAVPGTVVGIGYILAFNRPPLYLQGTWTAIVLLFIFRNAPLGIRAAIAALMQIDKSIEEASTNLGANRWVTIRRVVLPLLAPVFFSGLAFAFIRCMNSLSAVIFVVSGRWNLITISIMNFFENGQLSRAAALCVILVVLVLLATGILRLIIPRKRGRAFTAAA